MIQVLLICWFSGITFTENPLLKTRKEMLSQKWLLQSMIIEGKSYDEQTLASRSGVSNILEFTTGGKCYVKNLNGKIMQTSNWQFANNEQELIITNVDEGTKQLYAIEELTFKRLVLTMQDRDVINGFVYKAMEVKKKKKR